MKWRTLCEAATVAALLWGCSVETGEVEVEQGSQELWNLDLVKVKSLQTGEPVRWSKGALARHDDALYTKVVTSNLPPDTDITVVWAVFNFPDECTEGNPLTGSPCGPGDLANDAVGGTVSLLQMRNTGPWGIVGLVDTLAVGDTSGCMEGLPCRDGLTDPFDAEVHIVIIDDATGAFLQGAQFIPEDDGVEVIRTRDLQTGDPIIDSRGELERGADRVSTSVYTTGLPADTDLFVVWAVFNHPELCAEGNPLTGSPCGPGDLASDPVGGHISFYAATSSGGGEITINDTLAVGDTSRCVDGLPCRDGLTNPAGAEIHVVIIDDATGTFLQGAQFIP